ncbi:hypothetical protein K490DRAFT_60908 [Saccharata proteae CBS 121410]|uniref:MOSC domain-containing protein n=1 Tax=Saccharata proteae CBS 121410 TaxID=1314787 RepID=A0A9P4LZJ1_9PEZI|nr:hypothetical protein K490DRAFT_60908 [Saccharata proteae CBS 121410]
MSTNTPLLITILVVILPTTYFLLRFLSNRVGPNKTLTNSPPLPPPTEIIDLRVYPIKSCRGFPVQSTRLLKTGLELDRNWMFISMPKREFITIRNNPRMTLVDTSYDASADTLNIAIETTDPKISIPAHPSRDWLETHTRLSKAEIWHHETDGWEYSTDLTQPFSDFFEMDVRLVYKGPTERVLRGSGAPELLGFKGSTNFADMMPVQVSSMSSMQELNGRLRANGEDDISIERFRPNIIVRGGEPWSEDVWKELRISPSTSSTEKAQKPLELDVACRCLRCQVPNVDPDTAEKHPRQPWDTMMKYRRIDEGMKFKPGFGMLCVPRDEGLLEVGMKFEVTKTTSDHFFVSPMAK